MTRGGPEDSRLSTRRLLMRLGVSRSTLHAMMRDRGFPPGHCIGSRRFVWLSEVMEWEAANTSMEMPPAPGKAVAS